MISSHARKRKALLDCEADVRTVQHERQVVERGRDHGVLEPGDHRFALGGRARTRPCSRDLRPILTRESLHVFEGERRGQRLGGAVRLGVELGAGAASEEHPEGE